VIGAIAAGAVVVLLVLGALLFFCLRRKPAARDNTYVAAYNDKPFEAPPMAYQQNPVYQQQNPVYQQQNPGSSGLAGGRTYGVPEQTGGNWVNGEDVVGGRVGRPF